MRGSIAPRAPTMLDLGAKVAELEARGWCVLEGLLDSSTIDGIHSEMLQMLDACRARDRRSMRSCTVPAGASRPACPQCQTCH